MKHTKKIICIFTVIMGLFLFSISHFASASDFIQAHLYSARIMLDKQVQALPTEQPLLIYNEKAYVPLRYFSELTGIGVGFNNATNTIELSRNADVHTSAVYDDILFSIHTSKEIYAETEAIPLWGKAEYIGQNHFIELNGNYPISRIPRVIWANITDETGFNVPFGFDDIAGVIQLEKNKPAVWDVSDAISMYLYVKSHSSEKISYAAFRESLFESGKNNRLPKGKYTITALIRYEINHELRTKEQQMELNIEVR